MSVSRLWLLVGMALFAGADLSAVAGGPIGEAAVTVEIQADSIQGALRALCKSDALSTATLDFRREKGAVLIFCETMEQEYEMEMPPLPPVDGLDNRIVGRWVPFKREKPIVISGRSRELGESLSEGLASAGYTHEGIAEGVISIRQVVLDESEAWPLNWRLDERAAGRLTKAEACDLLKGAYGWDDGSDFFPKSVVDSTREDDVVWDGEGKKDARVRDLLYSVEAYSFKTRYGNKGLTAFSFTVVAFGEEVRGGKRMRTWNVLELW